MGSGNRADQAWDFLSNWLPLIVARAPGGSGMTLIVGGGPAALADNAVPMDTRASSASTAATSTLAAPPAELRPRAERLPELCQTGVILRTLLFVQVVVGTGAAFGSPTLASWCLRSAVAAAVAVPATLGWLIAACSATPLLARLPKVAREALVAAAAGF